MLTINLFDCFAVALNDVPLQDFPTDATRALLAYLAVHADRAQVRADLAAFLWPDQTSTLGLQNLRSTLYRLRGALADRGREVPFLLTDRRTIRFNPDSPYTLDVAQFSDLYEAIRHNETWLPLQRRRQMETAVALFHPRVVPELGVDSDDFEAWRSGLEARSRQQALWLLDQLARIDLELEDFQAMLRHARQQVELDPLNEAGHKNEMSALLGLGRRREAVAHYDAFRQSLEDNLGLEPSPALQALYREIKPATGPPPVSNPYRGLDAFREENAADFFGREAVVARLQEMVVERPLVALIGPSGSGKSSVACAGLCPHLRRAGWHILRLQPGTHPWQALAEAISTQIPAVPPLTPDALADGRYPPAALRRSVPTAQHGERPPPLLIVVDQFEQLFTLLPDETQQHAFIDWLLAASLETGVHLLLTMRADFMAQALVYRPLADALQPGLLPIGSMTHSELRRAIIYPATNRGVTFQDGLIKRILDDVATAPGQLPLLQFALTRLWEEREENWLTHRAYEANEGVAGALSHHAQAFYDELDAAGQQLARRIFLRLVQPGQGTADTSRPTARAELPPPAWPLVQRMADARLLVTGYDESGREVAALSHEVLITGWLLLREWLDEDRAFYTWRQRLDSARAQWQGSDRDAGALLRGALLSEAERWLATRASDLSPASVAYIEASLQSREARARVVEAQRQQELAQVQALAEAESQRATIAARARQRLRLFVAGLIFFLFISILATAAAVQQRQQAQRAAVVAQSLNLATSAQLALNEGDTGLALTLATEANRLPDPPLQVQRMLAAAAYAPGARRVFIGHDGPVTDVAVVPDRWEQVLSASADGTMILWDLKTGELIRRYSGHDAAVNSVVFLPQGNQILSAAADGTLILWDVDTGAITRRLTGHEGAVWDVAVAPDCVLRQSACLAISAAEDGTLILWDVATGDVLRRFTGHAGPVYTVAISPDGRTALSGSADTSLIAWEIETGQIIYQLQRGGRSENPAGEDTEVPLIDGHRGPVRDVMFGRNGRTAYSVGDDLRIIYWEMETGGLLRVDTFNTALYSVDLSSDGRHILLGRTDGRVTLWSPFYSQTLLNLLGHAGRIQAVAFSPDGRQAISGAADGSVRLWDLRSSAEMRTMTIDGSALDVALSPDGSEILLAGATGDLSLWDYDKGVEIRRLVGHTETPFAGALFRQVSDDGTLVHIVSGGGNIFDVAQDGTLRLWDLATGREIRRFEGHTDHIWDFDVSADGRFAVSASHDGTLRLWDLDEGTGIVLADFSPQSPRSVAISPNGETILVGLAKGASSTPDFSLRLLDRETGAALRTFAGHTEIVNDIAFSPDGRTALSGAHDKLLILWDVESGQAVRRFEGHTGAVNQVRFSPVTAEENGGRFALSAGVDNLIILWDLATGAALRTYRGHVGGVMSVAFAPDGRSFFSVALDDSVREWRIDAALPDLQAWIAENRTVLPLTCEQEVQFGMRLSCDDG